MLCYVMCMLSRNAANVQRSPSLEYSTVKRWHSQNNFKPIPIYGCCMFLGFLRCVFGIPVSPAAVGGVAQW